MSRPPGLKAPFRVDVKGEELAARTAGESTCSLPGQLALTLPSRARLLLSRMACTQFTACMRSLLQMQVPTRASSRAVYQTSRLGLACVCDDKLPARACACAGY